LLKQRSFLFNVKSFAMKKFFILIFSVVLIKNVHGQIIIPKVYTNLSPSPKGEIIFDNDGLKLTSFSAPGIYSLQNFYQAAKGSESGIDFDFKLPNFNGTLFFGLIPLNDVRYPVPFYSKTPVAITAGKASINIRKDLSDLNDIVAWGQNKKGLIGYRILDQSGKMIYEGRVAFRGAGPFEVVNTIVEGPFVSKVTTEGCTVAFTTSQPEALILTVEYLSQGIKKTKDFPETTPSKKHEIEIKGFFPATEYVYRIIVGGITYQFSFTTLPKPGSRQPFSFAFASDSRYGAGGGERNAYGVNYYTVRKFMSLASMKNVSFFQFSGDLINGYCLSKDEINHQYANWKKAVEPWAHYMPVYTAMGNHELLMYMFPDDEIGKRYMLDKFPFDMESSEAVFAENFTNPENGPKSEDGAPYDPDPKSIDFPTYSENVYYYTYDNVAIVVLNTHYWFSPSVSQNVLTSGNPAGYIMDNQLSWLRTTINKLEADKDIDHIFITLHTPFFPNGGHAADAFWYNGNNRGRAVVTGNAMRTGIIERRDEILDLIVNASRKTVAVLCGDEHNYSRMEITPQTKIYTDDYNGKKITLTRSIWQITNGTAGAPVYAQELTPWTESVKKFSIQNSLVFFHINGKSVKMEVINPVTLEKIEEITLKEQ